MNTVTAKIAADIIAIAELHIGQGRRPMSVRECLTDAMTWYKQGEFMFAAKRALKSLHYSVGADHADYQQAAALIG